MRLLAYRRGEKQSSKLHATTQLHSYTAAQLHSRAAAQPRSCAAAQLRSCAAAQLRARICVRACVLVHTHIVSNTRSDANVHGPPDSQTRVACRRRCANETDTLNPRPGALRPISLLRLSLLRLLESNFPGNSLWAWKFRPF